MEFSVVRESFLKALQRVVGAVGRRPNMPILSHVWIGVKNQLLSLTATDLELELSARLPLSDPAVGGAISLPAKKLLDVCKAFPEGVTLDFKVMPHKENIHPKVKINAGKSCFTIAGLSADGFPKVEDGPGILEFSLKNQEIRSLMDSTSFAMAQQDVRYYLNGLLLAIQNDGLRAVAADGHRLATYSLNPTHPIQLEFAQSIIIPRKAIMEMQRLFTEDSEVVGFKMSTHHLRAMSTEFSFCTKLIDGKFPDYRKVLPKGNCLSVIIERLAFKQSLQRVAVLLSDKHKGACFRLETSLMKIVAVNADKDQVEEEIEIQYTGPVMEIGLNVGYIIDYLNYLNVSNAPYIKMQVIDPNQSIVFEPVEASNEGDRSLYVVMPVKL